MPKVHRVMVLVFGLFSMHVGIMVHVFGSKSVYTVLTNLESMVATSLENAFLIPTNSSLAVLYAKIPILDKYSH